ncbi:50S ribosomal protein L23 [Candidatus Nanohalobium constans]|uniref:Large ribosomal subunit protein uL23 n=1 Tax=Candidatus Nanohalobium constans TaxID=2565781 RepID=A0A5Q0UH87_9ARCH|nr:50S ribosomal protein L23 [Candidatus Nanohalobium constans]QGA80987.1 50S ribosomal protein L23 [Candidatus Nanohalobium constans]
MEVDRAWEVIENPHMTEQAMDMIDQENKLVLMVDLEADKNQVQDAIETLFDVTVEKVNTNITSSAKKKAFVRLSPSDDAMDLATELGMM